eukprot:515051-Pyramimonas_sp.AAC.2
MSASRRLGLSAGPTGGGAGSFSLLLRRWFRYCGAHPTKLRLERLALLQPADVFVLRALNVLGVVGIQALRGLVNLHEPVQVADPVG